MTSYTPSLVIAMLTLLLLTVFVFVVIHSGFVIVLMPNEDYVRYCAAYPTRCL